ncbi:DUF995 domain-containing protein [Mesorhizobium sp. B4-1-1]|uniref:DUF995 domain-containing protein n=1 Tax=Mesorhizobium sp. B4-1-1 TaxID=2589890 RepID=UPI00112B2BA3|nr:DUF995 domain-containing protein [Mesorhizobium sp. B4-1-1]TPI18373.1 hypothetical protein FJW10_19340 [Mesorhizobium sp. B4-1-1]
MRKFQIFLAAGVVASLTGGPVLAGKLPKDAVPLSADEVKAIYSGKTGLYGTSTEYYAPDGTTKGFVGKSKITATFKGTWSVNGNEVCAKNKPKGESKIYTDCNKYWRSGKKVFDLWATHYDGSTPDMKNGYATDTAKKLRSGDLVSAKYAAAGGE